MLSGLYQTQYAKSKNIILGNYLWEFQKCLWLKYIIDYSKIHKIIFFLNWRPFVFKDLEKILFFHNSTNVNLIRVTVNNRFSINKRASAKVLYLYNTLYSNFLYSNCAICGTVRSFNLAEKIFFTGNVTLAAPHHSCLLQALPELWELCGTPELRTLLKSSCSSRSEPQWATAAEPRSARTS